MHVSNGRPQVVGATRTVIGDERIGRKKQSACMHSRNSSTVRLPPAPPLTLWSDHRQTSKVRHSKQPHPQHIAQPFALSFPHPQTFSDEQARGNGCDARVSTENAAGDILDFANACALKMHAPIRELERHSVAATYGVRRKYIIVAKGDKHTGASTENAGDGILDFANACAQTCMHRPASSKHLPSAAA